MNFTRNQNLNLEDLNYLSNLYNFKNLDELKTFINYL